MVRRIFNASFKERPELLGAPQRGSLTKAARG
jgi:hypothetical protein